VLIEVIAPGKDFINQEAVLAELRAIRVRPAQCLVLSLSLDHLGGHLVPEQILQLDLSFPLHLKVDINNITPNHIIQYQFNHKSH
jgi:hypothetical protein